MAPVWTQGQILALGRHRTVLPSGASLSSREGGDTVGNAGGTWSWGPAHRTEMTETQLGLGDTATNGPARSMNELGCYCSGAANSRYTDSSKSHQKSIHLLFCSAPIPTTAPDRYPIYCSVVSPWINPTQCLGRSCSARAGQGMLWHPLPERCQAQCWGCWEAPWHQVGS